MEKKFGDDVLICGWMRNRNTLEFIGIWEQILNRGSKGLEFETLRSQAGLNNFSLTPRKWTEANGAIGFQSRAGRYGGGTSAHEDIAFEFGSWLRPEFKLYLIKEFQRLNLTWNLQRTLAKINYRIHADAIKEALIPSAITSKQAAHIYADEADLAPSKAQRNRPRPNAHAPIRFQPEATEVAHRPPFRARPFPFPLRGESAGLLCGPGLGPETEVCDVLP